MKAKQSKANGDTDNTVPAAGVSRLRQRSEAVSIRVQDEADWYSATARTLTRPEIGAAAAIEKWQENTHDVNELAKELAAQIAVVNNGDLSRAEGMLIAQAHTLNDVFNNLLRRATSQKYLAQWEAYMRMGMKAQSQCRSTLEALAEIKNPRAVAFVRQANIANGPQQVNNGVSAEPPKTVPNEQPATLQPRTLEGPGGAEALGASEGIGSRAAAIGRTRSTEVHETHPAKHRAGDRKTRQGASLR